MRFSCGGRAAFKQQRKDLVEKACYRAVSCKRLLGGSFVESDNLHYTSLNQLITSPDHLSLPLQYGH
jgi:hypothetical protein